MAAYPALGTGQPTPPDWGQVALAALFQNLATGLTFGSFGTMVLAVEHAYGASRAQSSLALSLAVVSLSLFGMAAGRVINRLDLRRLMLAGAALLAAGFAAAALAQGPFGLLAAYALLIGPGTALLGVLPTMTLATRHVPGSLRGRALGVVNLPVLVMLVPLLIGPWLPELGPRRVYAGLSAGLVLLAPLLLLVRSGVDPAADDRAVAGTAPRILGSGRFWVLAMAVGLLTGAGTMKLAHFVPLLIGQGRSFAEANMLLALSGGTGILGSLLFGALTDRLGPLVTLALNAAIQALVWAVFLAPVSLPVLVFDAVVVGAAGGGVQAAFGAAVVAMFGARAFGRAYGLFQFATLPFLFGMTPVASLLYQRSGTYTLPMAVTIACLALAALLFAMLAGSKR